MGLCACRHRTQQARVVVHSVEIVLGKWLWRLALVEENVCYETLEAGEVHVGKYRPLATHSCVSERTPGVASFFEPSIAGKYVVCFCCRDCKRRNIGDGRKYIFWVTMSPFNKSKWMGDCTGTQKPTYS